MAKNNKLANREKQAFNDIPSSNKDRIDACRKHVKSDSHKNALAMPLVQPLLQDNIKLNDVQIRNAMEHKFVVAYWIAQKHVANEKYESLSEMLVGSIDGSKKKKKSIFTAKRLDYKAGNTTNAQCYKVVIGQLCRPGASWLLVGY